MHHSEVRDQGRSGLQLPVGASRDQASPWPKTVPKPPDTFMVGPHRPEVAVGPSVGEGNRLALVFVRERVPFGPSVPGSRRSLPTRMMAGAAGGGGFVLAGIVHPRLTSLKLFTEPSVFRSQACIPAPN